MESGWSNGQIELFHALRKICERIGKEEAIKLLREGSDSNGFDALDRGSLLAELQELREKASLVDVLKKENLHLKAELDATLEQLDSSFAMTASRVTGKKDGSTYQSSSVQTAPEPIVGYSSELGGRYEHLIQKQNALVKNHQELVLAREKMEIKLRATKSLNREWIEYAKRLEKKIERLKKTLASHETLMKDRFTGSPAVKALPSVSRSSSEFVSVETPDPSLEALSRELPNFLHLSERISELARNATGRLSHHPQPATADQLQHQTVELHSYEEPVSLLNDNPRLHRDINTLQRQPSRVSQKLLDKAAVPEHDSQRPFSAQSHHSDTTEEGDDGGINIANREHVDLLPIVKLESTSDTPIVISSRSVRRRESRSDAGPNGTTPYAKVKVEDLSSSPIGLAGLQNVLPQESMDLDDIGEKMNTPKKRRQVIQSSHSFIGGTTHNKMDVQGHVSQGSIGRVRVGLQRGESKARLKGRLSVLQSESPNRQILPRTSGKGQEPKRRRLEVQVEGAAILAEDGENDSEMELLAENRRELLPEEAAKLQQHLGSLLEKPPPGKEALISAKTLNISAPTAHLRPRNIHVDKVERIASSVRHQISPGMMLNSSTTSGDTPEMGHNPKMSKGRAAQVTENIGTLEADGLDQEPLRARPVHRLGLEHFKINPRFNQGADYAFADVVRGRESRRCLPGCTKPKCCGGKFQMLIELVRGQEQRSRLQEEDDARLLEEYLGDNKGGLLKMTGREKEELLIKAKTRELSNKASKHRHAYERRPSPPGFWRSDFPSTQELLTDREQAHKVERELVQQRYEEAMRPGGRWLFRDE